MAHHFEEIDGKPHRVDDGQVNLGLAVDVEKKDGSRTLMVPGDPRRRAAAVRRASSPPTTRSSRRRARTRSTADDLVGANITLTNPGGLGTVASVPRLMSGQGTIVATGSIAYPVGLGDVGAHDRRGEGHDDDLDLRPPHHPGRRVGPLPRARSRATCRARTASTRASSRRSASSSARAAAARAAAAARRRRAAAGARRAAPAGEELLQAVQAASTLVEPRPQPRAPRRAPGPARLRARGRPGLDPEALGLTPEIQAQIPATILRNVRPRRDARRRAAAPARDLLRHDRLRDRAHRLAPPARVAARAHRVGRLPPAS